MKTLQAILPLLTSAPVLAQAMVDLSVISVQRNTGVARVPTF